MKNKSIIAKLLAEEDIFVVYKKMETAYFNPKTRELGLPIWNDELMTADIEDLMVCHEIAHALWTPLDMLEQAQSRKINHSFVNIIEDARIEKLMKRKFPGLRKSFNGGYKELNNLDFFEIVDQNLDNFSLIDRINLHFKIGASAFIPFGASEIVFVERTEKAETFAEVLQIAFDVYQ